MFNAVKRDISEEYYRLFIETNERFSYKLNVYDEKIIEVGDNLRYSDNNGETTKTIDWLNVDISKFELGKLFVFFVINSSVSNNEKIIQDYIDKIVDLRNKREEFIKQNIKSAYPYNIIYDSDGKGLYSETNFPFIDTRSKNYIIHIKRNFRNRKCLTVKNWIVGICAFLGSIASIVSIIFTICEIFYSL
jgi:hypothetical protein